MKPGYYWARFKKHSGKSEWKVVEVCDWPGGGLAVWESGSDIPYMINEWEFATNLPLEPPNET